MIQFSKLGKLGRFANQMWEIAATYSLAQKYDVDWRIPAWSYSKYFETVFPEGEMLSPDHVYKEPHYKYKEINSPDLWAFNKVTDLQGYFQDTRHWWLKEEDIRNLFKFKQEYVDEVIREYSYLYDKSTIAVGVRRGDYVGSLKGNYHILSPSYYINALQKFDYEKYNIVFISDDLEWCKFHFGCLPNAFFPSFNSDIYQFIAGSLCDNWIIGNSTFHFFSAFLGTASKSGRVIQPTKLFAGKLLEKEGDVNFYKKEWEFQDDTKVDLKDVTFTIPSHYDHPDRKENLELSICLLQKAFDTNIIVGEQGDDKHFEHTKDWCRYMYFNYADFHRTKMLNEMAKASKTSIVVNWDADVALPPAQIWQAVEKLRKNNADMVYPYEYLFARINRVFRRQIFPDYDLSVYKRNTKGTDTLQNPSMGGAVFFNKKSFLDGGGENEKFISYGPEDRERYERFTKLGYRISRIKGNLYHFDHYIGINSSTRNPHYQKSSQEYEKIKQLSQSVLKSYVDTWPWRIQYTEQYYSEISPTATISRDEVFKQLEEDFIYTKGDTILDFGCGIGEWGIGLPSYTGVDYNVPREKLLINQYIDHDLTHPFHKGHKANLILCLEVGEHIEERFAKTLVKSICDAATDTILFSAAFPGQGGIDHCNEKWPSWWAKLFEEHGFYPHTEIRDTLKSNPNIDIWYRNNIILYTPYRSTKPQTLDFILPEYYENILKHHRLL